MDGVTTDQEWISTGKAAKLLGYSRWTFLDKFQDCLPCRVLPSGHRRWLESAVSQLAASELRPTG